MNYTVRVMGKALFICLVTSRLSRNTNNDFLFISPDSEILLRRREREKFKNSSGSDLQALCQSFDLVLACVALAMCLQNSIYIT